MSESSVLLVICALVGGCLLPIFGNQYLREDPNHARREREPYMNMLPPFMGFQPAAAPMMQGYGYPGRIAGNEIPPIPRASGNDSSASNSTYYKYNDTKVSDPEYYEPNYCEALLVEEMTKAIKYSVTYNLEGKYGKLKKNRYAVIVSSILPEAVYDGLYKGEDIVEAITQAVAAQYKEIPLGSDDPKVKEFEANAFKEKAKYATTEILDGMCKYTYCCLNANQKVEYYKVPEKPAL